MEDIDMTYMNTKALVLIMDAIPEPIENQSAKNNGLTQTLTQNPDGSFTMHKNICMMYQLMPELSVNEDKMYQKAKPNYVRRYIWENIFSNIFDISEEDIVGINNLRDDNIKFRQLLQQKSQICVNGNEKPTLTIEMLIEICGLLDRDNYHFDRVRTSIIQAVIGHIKNEITMMNIFMLLRSYKNNEGRLSILDALLQKVSSNGISINDHFLTIMDLMDTLDGKTKAAKIMKPYIENTTYDYLSKTIRSLNNSKQWSQSGLFKITKILIGRISELQPTEFINFYEILAKGWSVTGKIEIMNSLVEKVKQFSSKDYIGIIKFFDSFGSNSLFDIIHIVSPKADTMSSDEFSDIITHFKPKLGSDNLIRFINKMLEKVELLETAKVITLVKLFKPSLNHTTLVKVSKLLMIKTKNIDLNEYETFMNIFKNSSSSVRQDMRETIKVYLKENLSEKIEQEVKQEKETKKKQEIEIVELPETGYIYSKGMINKNMWSHLGMFNGESVTTVNGRGIKTYEWWVMNKQNYTIEKVYRMSEYAW